MMYCTTSHCTRSTGLQLDHHNPWQTSYCVGFRATPATHGCASAAIPTGTHLFVTQQVAVPHFGPKSDVPEVDKLAQVPHRRQGQQILAEMAREQEQAWGHAPQPAGRHHWQPGRCFYQQSPHYYFTAVGHIQPELSCAADAQDFLT